jgi:hypothetical protein
MRMGYVWGLALWVLFLLGLSACGTAPAFAVTDPQNPPPCNSNPCVIKRDVGGLVHEYEQLALRVRLTGWRIVIDGECYSACAILADKARPFVCLTPKARLFFHQMYGTYTDPLAGLVILRRPYTGHTKDVAAWIAFNGGQPLSGWLYMPYPQARHFWPSCEEPPFSPTKDK